MGDADISKASGAAQLSQGTPTSSIDKFQSAVVRTQAKSTKSNSAKEETASGSKKNSDPFKDNPEGMIEYKVQKNDTLKNIAENHGLTEAELADINNFSEKGRAKHVLKAGEKLTILDKQRTDAYITMKSMMVDVKSYEARNSELLQQPIIAPLRDQYSELREKTDQQWLKIEALAAAEIDYALQNEAVPADQLAKVSEELKARFPGNPRYSEAIDQASGAMVQKWESQGRIHAVLDPLTQAVNAGNWDQVQGLVRQQFDNVARINPTESAINQHADIITGYGPDNARFRDITNAIKTDILVDRPYAIAESIRQAYENGGPAEAGNKLREVTNPRNVDPLTAGLAVRLSKPIIESIATNIKDISTRTSMPNPLSPGYANQAALGPIIESRFRNLNAALDSASRSPVANATINAAANILKDTHFLADVAKTSVSAGEGTVLPLAIAKARQDSGHPLADEMVKVVGEGVQELETTVRKDVRKFFYDMEEVRDPAVNWKDFLGEKKAQKAVDLYTSFNPQFMQKMQTDLQDKIDPGGYKIIRALDGLSRYSEQLKNLSNGTELVKRQDILNQDNAELKLATSFASGSIETYRFLNQTIFGTEQAAAIANITVDPGWALRSARGVAKQAPAIGELARSLPSFNLTQVIQSLQAKTTIPADMAWYRPFSPPGMALSSVGVITYPIGIGVWLSGDDVTLRHYANAIQYSGGFVKELVELATGSVEYIAEKTLINAHELHKLSPAEIKEFMEQRRTNPLSKIGRGTHVGWSRYAKGLSVAGGVLDAWGAATYYQKQDYWRAVPLTISASASALPFIVEGAWVGPVGALASIGAASTILGKNAWDHHKEVTRLEEPTENFLKLADPSIDPDLAKYLSNHNSEGQSIAPALSAFAKHLNVSPSAMYDWIKDTHSKNKNFIDTFVKFGLQKLKTDAASNFIVSKQGADIALNINIYDPSGSFQSFTDYPIDANTEIKPDQYVTEAYTLQGLEKLVEHNGFVLPKP